MSGKRLTHQISTRDITRQASRGNFYCLVKLKIKEKKVEVIRFPKSKLEEANQALLESEKDAEIQSVLVSIGDIKNLQKAYPNYFLDTAEFLKKLKEIIE